MTVVRQILARTPGEDVVYLGDSARVPYGTKSPETVREFARQDAAFLQRFDPKLIVVACNTASAVAMDALREAVPVDVIGVVAPAAQVAVRQAAGGLIGVVGTEGTIASDAHRKAVEALDADGKFMAAAAPLLVPIVEEGRAQDDPIVLSVLGDYLRRMQRARPAVLILGCTHYPLLSRAISKLMGPATALLDPGEATAEAVRRRLAARGMLNPQPKGTLKCFSTDTPDRFARLARRFLGQDVQDVEWVGTDELAGAGQGVTA